MKSFVNQVFVFVFVLVFSILYSLKIPAQTALLGTDSVIFTGVKSAKDRFTFSDGGTREISVRGKQTKLAADKGKQFASDAGNGLITLMGLNMSSSDEVSLKVPGTIICNDGLPDWEVALFCEGFMEKSRERVRDEDGSLSVNTETVYTYYWEKEATGTLEENGVTIASFIISMYPREDSLLKPMAGYFLLPPQVKEVKEPTTMKELMETFATNTGEPSQKDYGIRGTFRGKPFSMVSDARQNKSWIFYEGRYTAMVYGGNLMNHKNKGVPDPYILIKIYDSGPERRDLFRLVMVCRYLNYTLGL